MTAEMYEERLRKHGSFLLQIHDALGPYRGDGSLVEAVGELRAENERLRADLLTAYGQAAEQQVEIGRLCMRLGELRLSNDALCSGCEIADAVIRKLEERQKEAENNEAPYSFNDLRPPPRF